MECKHTPLKRFGPTVLYSDVICKRCGKRIEPRRPVLSQAIMLCAIVFFYHLVLLGAYLLYNKSLPSGTYFSYSAGGGFTLSQGVFLKLFLPDILVMLGRVLLLVYILWFAGKMTSWRLVSDEPGAPHICAAGCRHRPRNPAVFRPLEWNKTFTNTDAQLCTRCGGRIVPKNGKRLTVVGVSGIGVLWLLHRYAIGTFNILVKGISKISEETVEQLFGAKTTQLYRFLLVDALEILLLFVLFLCIGYFVKWVPAHSHEEEMDIGTIR